MLIAALFIIAKRWKLHKYSSTDKWICKMCQLSCLHPCSSSRKSVVERGGGVTPCDTGKKELLEPEHTDALT